MPELPEVETICRGVVPHVVGQCVTRVAVYQAQLRWPVPENLAEHIVGKVVERVWRRGKYMLWDVGQGAVLWHFGMSGYVSIVDPTKLRTAHDHLDIVLQNGECMRFNDQRRFGAVLWLDGVAEEHALLAHIGPEPLALTARALARHCMIAAQRKRVAVKVFLMDGKVLSGVGNIYATEALFKARIHPLTSVQALSIADWVQLMEAVQETLQEAIAAGGTTLRDFKAAHGKPGYFQQQLLVYGKFGQPCPSCGKALAKLTIAQRTTTYCAACQLKNTEKAPFSTDQVSLLID